MQRTGRILLLVLTIALVISTIVTIKTEREKRQLGSAYANAQALLADVRHERDSLNDELTKAREIVETQAADLRQLQEELNGLQAHLKDSEDEITKLQADHLQLETTNTQLNQELALTVEEKRALEAKLSSITELKLAIRSVKQRLRQERWESWLAHVQAEREQDQRDSAYGNRGFLVHEGISTLGSSNKLQVRVLDPQAQ